MKITREKNEAGEEFSRLQWWAVRWWAVPDEIDRRFLRYFEAGGYPGDPLVPSIWPEIFGCEDRKCWGVYGIVSGTVDLEGKRKAASK